MLLLSTCCVGGDSDGRLAEMLLWSTCCAEGDSGGHLVIHVLKDDVSRCGHAGKPRWC